MVNSRVTTFADGNLDTIATRSLNARGELQVPIILQRPLQSSKPFTFVLNVMQWSITPRSPIASMVELF